MSKFALVLVGLLATSYVCDAYKILVIFPLPAKSHSNLGKGIVRHLIKAGHEVSYVTPYPHENVHPNLTYIDLSSNIDLFPDDIMNLSEILDGRMDLADTGLMLIMLYHISVLTVERENFLKLLGDPNQHFDLVISEWMFTELYCGIAQIFNAPLIWFSTVEPHGLMLSLIDDYLNPAYNGFEVGASAPFTFYERIYELWFIIKVTLIRNVLHLFASRDYHRVLVPFMEQRGVVPSTYKEAVYNASLTLGNSHFSLGQAIRLPQNYKPIGGFHIEDKIKPLPKDLQKLMDEAKDGVIYFSMGSNLKSKDLPDRMKKDFLQVFGSLKQTVLWKFEEEQPNLPKNVHILKWAPQLSVLSHPNCILFITHGGLLSTSEAIHAGVPLIGIPVFADQLTNTKRMVRKGIALQVNLSYDMAGDLKKAIDEMVSEPKYREKAKELSFIFHDRPVPPGAELVHWAEHVIKTRGAPHLRSPALLVPWYQKYYIDLIILISLAGYTLKRIINLIWPMIFRKRNDLQKKFN